MQVAVLDDGLDRMPTSASDPGTKRYDVLVEAEPRLTCLERRDRSFEVLADCRIAVKRAAAYPGRCRWPGRAPFATGLRWEQQRVNGDAGRAIAIHCRPERIGVLAVVAVVQVGHA